ncbi:thioredoxin family protein [Macrococcoides bohemicum]|uniref:Thiol reductase thioredoxin n=1 Tax=Macrococcoides bohemicum TaxID=1903056 RepID=A0A328AA71_9STAP|nr:thioredoxin family protein [Macrococcus bohemicus]RAK50058.1 thiol reductase thioredoxin [Macrococcus bohemicus]
MKKIAHVEAFREAITQPTIAMFTATWCPDCHFIDPLMPEIEAENPEYQFISIDRDEFIDLAVEYEVMGIPSFIAFKDSEVIGRFVSKDRKTKDQVNEFIQSL